MITSPSSPGYGPIVVHKTIAVLNLSGCLVHKDPGELQCAKNIQKYTACVDASCGSCAGAAQAEVDACRAEAKTTTCAIETMDARNCTDRLQNVAAVQTCFVDFAYEREFCGF